MKTVQLQPQAERSILQEQHRLHTGILLGQSWDHRVYILSAISTPPLRPSSSSRWSRVDWFTEHARHVRRMLVGGMEIVGMFVADSAEEEDRASEAELKDMLHGLPLSAGTVDCILLRATGASKVVTGEVYSTAKRDPKPLTSITIANIARDIVAFETTLDVDVTVPVHRVSSASSSSPSVGAATAIPLKLQLRKGLESLQASVMAAQATIDGASVDGALMLEKAFEAHRSGSSSNFDSSNHDMHSSAQLVEFSLTPPLPLTADPTATGTVRLQGPCHGRVYAHKEYSVSQALLALKYDVINSLQSRLQLLCEDSEEALGSFDLPPDESSFTWDLPRRLFQPLVPPACVCDYLLPHEQEEDGVRRIAELLGVPDLADRGNPPFMTEGSDGEEESEDESEDDNDEKSEQTTSSSSNSSSNSSASTAASKSLTTTSSAPAPVAKSSRSSLLLPLAVAALLLALSAAFFLQMRA